MSAHDTRTPFTIKKSRQLAIALVACIIGSGAPSARASAVDVLDTFNFLDHSGPSVFGSGGTFLSFGGDFAPAAGTSVIASQGTVFQSVPYLNSPALPNQFFASIPY